ncbi:LIC10729 family protein [Leptospira ognonensis]|uniref:LIC10729 family protein n=1 Tax=Leptospira ognonensis TaxID=2484945 RepID=UPI001FEC205D|nr:hypothetical protein [Leptospira ognonensis]
MLHLKLKSLLLTAIFFWSVGSYSEIYAEDLPKASNEFPVEEGLLPEDIGTFPELKTWALYQFLELEEDSTLFGIQDQVCRMIPETGLKFLLGKETAHKGRMYLYLDLTRYLPQKRARFKPRKLAIYVNGHLKKEIYMNKNKTFANPVEVPIEPSEFDLGKINIELIPSKNETGRFWGIWDAFLVENRKNED